MNRRIVVKESGIFSAAIKKGRYSANNLLVVYSIKNYRRNAPSRLGISVSAKNGNAVRRNRVKRIIREAFRALYHCLPKGQLIIVTARKPAFEKNIKMTDIKSALEYSLRKLKIFL